jgi:sulfite exporter TauE/SafE
MEILLISALSIGVIHAMAPDHWLPFVMLGRAQQWSGWKTTRVVSLAGLGHVGSSIIIAAIGLAAGAALEHVNGWDEVRGNFASLLLIGFGLVYAVWGMFHWKKHTHEHSGHHHHQHGQNTAAVVSYWTLFALIVFGPCEPLIPLLFASMSYGWMSVAAIFAAFSIVTVAMMLLQVHLALLGLSMMRFHFLKDASHIIAGIVIALTGVAIRLLGI